MNTQLLQQILDQLERRRQAATYGAVAGLVGSTPQEVMKGHPRTSRHSWVVNASTERPSGYREAEYDPQLLSSIKERGVIGAPEALDQWLQGEQRPLAASQFVVSHAPLRTDEGGAVRVGRSRVTLDLVIEEYESGMTPEDIASAYDSLDLADVHAVIAYYLRCPNDVLAYLKDRGETAKRLRAMVEARRPPISREDLLRHHKVQKAANAEIGD